MQAGREASGKNLWTLLWLLLFWLSHVNQTLAANRARTYFWLMMIWACVTEHLSDGNCDRKTEYVKFQNKKLRLASLTVKKIPKGANFLKGGGEIPRIFAPLGSKLLGEAKILGHRTPVKSVTKKWRRVLSSLWWIWYSHWVFLVYSVRACLHGGRVTLSGGLP
jgi:hypothetical protein